MTEQNLAVIEVSNLIPIAYSEREKFFLNENNQAQSVVSQIVKHYKNLVIDGSTEEGRKELKNLGVEINKVIALIDGYGKEINDVLKAKPKLIDASRKLIKDQLTSLRTELIEPYTKYEAEQKRIKEEEQAKIAAQQKADKDELERLRAEKVQQEREAKIAQDAADKAKLEAENKANEAELTLQRERDENERKERARLAEIQRKKDEETRRMNDIEHRRKINRQVMESLTNFGITEETAADIIKLIATNKIPNITINY